MIGDARAVPAGRELATDVCIVGAGAAGITLAQALIGTSLSAVVLESGGLEFDLAAHELSSGTNSGLPYSPLQDSRLRFFGGSTNHWAGYCRPLETVDFLPRQEIPGSGWPISRVDLDPYYVRARPIVGLPAGDFQASDAPARDGPQPLPLPSDRLVTVVAEIVRRLDRPFPNRLKGDLEAAADVEVLLHANAVEIETDPLARRVERVHVATLDGGRFTVRARAVVIACGGIENARLLLASDRVQAGGVGNDRDLVGRYFLEHPRFVGGRLLPADSGIDAQVYQPHDVAGREYIGYLSLAESVMRDEQLVEVQIQLRTAYDAAIEAALESQDVAAMRELVRTLPDGAASDRFADHVGRVMSDLATWQDVVVPGGPLAVPLPEVVDEAIRRGASGDIEALLPLLFGDLATVGVQEFLGGLPIRHIDLTTRIDPVPNPDSRVLLGDERDALGMRRADLHWALSALDKWSVIRTLEILGAEVGRAGLGRVQIGITDDDTWPEDLAGGPHHMGTTRMSDDAATGVVDRDCRVHGVDGLYVAGSSVFTTGGSGTPTLTIVALALRLADHLRDRLA